MPVFDIKNYLLVGKKSKHISSESLSAASEQQDNVIEHLTASVSMS
jgi:hypothetical protein